VVSINLLGVMIARRRERVAVLVARLVAMAEAGAEGAAGAALMLRRLWTIASATRPKQNYLK
jgi:hypothetical protein